MAMGSGKEKAAGYLPDSFVRRVVNWHLLRGFGISGVGTVSIAVPFIGYVILYHEQIQPWLGGLGGLLNSEEGRCGPWISFMLRLHFLYLGGLLLGVGTIVFRLSAHPVVKSYSDITEYVSSQASALTARNLRSMYATIRARRPSIADQLLRRAEWLSRDRVDLKVASDTFNRSNDKSLVFDVARSYYNVLDRYSLRSMVYLTTLFYIIGFSLLLIPGAFFSARVLCVIGVDWFGN